MSAGVYARGSKLWICFRGKIDRRQAPADERPGRRSVIGV
jgi:hypothetical protein